MELKKINMADARARFPELIRKVEEGETVVVGRYGTPVAVVLSYEKFDQMEEDIDDLRAMLEAEIEMRRSGVTGRTLEEVLADKVAPVNP